jgi:uncharacterized repeat protein (TIGR04052 family)
LSARRIVALALACLGTSCSQSDLGFSIPFAATWDGSPIDCSSTSPALSDLRFYVSDVQLIDGTGQARDIRFATEMPWQNDAVALIDLEDGTGACINGTSDVASEIIAVAPSKEYRGLRFTVGVPFRLNHLNPLTAGPPLDDPDMHWHWRSGYKFLRAGVRTENDGFWIHVGSAGCEGTVGNITNCRFPHRVEVELPDFVPGQSSVNIDLAQLLSGTDLDDKTASDCSSGPPEISCVAPFAALGIDFNSGQQNGNQHVFSTE